MNIEPIAHFRSPLTSKFGVPRQAGIVRELHGQIVFEPQYRNADADMPSACPASLGDTPRETGRNCRGNGDFG